MSSEGSGRAGYLGNAGKDGEQEALASALKDVTAALEDATALLKVVAQRIGGK
jgi:hypothetical protein